MSFEDRLHLVDGEFLSALTKGEEAIIAFNARWEGLLEEVNAALDANLLDDTTTILAHTTALRVATLAETSAALFASCDDLTLQFMGEIDSLMSQLDISGHRQNNYGPQPLSPSLSPDSSAPPLPKTCGIKRTRQDVDTPSPCKRPRRSPSRPINHSKVVPVGQAATTDLPLHSTPNVARFSKPCEVDVVLHSRKRRLSEAAIDPPHSPSERLYLGPRLHSVSDSFACRSTLSPISSSPCPISAYDFLSTRNTPIPETIKGRDSKHSSHITESLEDQVSVLPQSYIPWSISSFEDVCPLVPPTTSDETASILSSGLDDDKTVSSVFSSPYPTTPPALNSKIDSPHYYSMPSVDAGIADVGLNPDWIGFDIPPPSFEGGLDHAPLDGAWSSMLGIWEPSVWLTFPPPPYQLSSSSGFTLTKLTPSNPLDQTSSPDFDNCGSVNLDALGYGIRNATSFAVLA